MSCNSKQDEEEDLFERWFRPASRKSMTSYCATLNNFFCVLRRFFLSDFNLSSTYSREYKQSSFPCKHAHIRAHTARCKWKHAKIIMDELTSRTHTHTLQKHNTAKSKLSSDKLNVKCKALMALIADYKWKWLLRTNWNNKSKRGEWVKRTRAHERRKKLKL
jgi:hypothetical protein